MTIKEAQRQLRAVSMTLRHEAAYGEYRVNFRGGLEGSAYYTDDLEDALHTGLKMAELMRHVSDLNKGTVGME